MYRLLAVLPTVLSGLALSVSIEAQAASFDCNKAGTADEKAICRDLVLNDKDVRMELLYSIDRRFMGMGARGALIDEQSDWLKRRRACGAKTDCLNEQYDQRIAALRKFIDERVVTHGPF
ncbi:lysozyme inhibitor LprI family protein [Pseudomonas sp. S2_H01]